MAHQESILQLAHQAAAPHGTLAKVTRLLFEGHNGCVFRHYSTPDNVYGVVTLNDLEVRIGYRLDMDGRLRMQFESTLYESLVDATNGGKYDSLLMTQLATLCAQVAGVADADAFEYSLQFSGARAPSLGWITHLLLGKVDFDIHPPRTPLVAGVRLDLLAIQDVIAHWGRRAVSSLGGYAVWAPGNRG